MFHSVIIFITAASEALMLLFLFVARSLSFHE